MKRLILALVVIFVLSALALSGNRLAGRTLDTQLGPLLTRQLGLPVTLSPIKAHLLQLKANSPKLILGDPQNPAVVATDVEVTLAWSDLLHGNIRLASASATDLMVRLSRWPDGNSSTQKGPPDFRFLDPWLPGVLRLETGRYVSDSGDSYPVSQFTWQRQAEGSAALDWSEVRTAGDVTVHASLNSLPDLLVLAPIKIDLDIAVAGKPDSVIALQTATKPGPDAYTMQIDVQAAGLSAHTTATGQIPWRLPERSDTTIPLLDIDSLRTLLDSYRGATPAKKLGAELASTLPRLQLPAHRGHVAIDEIRMADETGKETAFDFTSGAEGLQIGSLTLQSPTGTLNGELGIASDSQGWTVNVDSTLQAREGQSDITPQSLASDWLWRSGRVQLNGKGDTWGILLNSLQGNLSLAGNYRSKVPIPVSVEARLDNRPGEFALDSLVITLGAGQLSGSAALSGTEQRKLTMNLKGTRLDLGFLFDREADQPQPGMALPEYLRAVPELDLNLTLDVEGLQAPGLNLGHLKGTLERSAQGGKLVATARGAQHGTLDLTLQAALAPDKPSDFQLSTNFSQMDITELFRQPGVLNSRSSGRLNFHSQGNGMKDIFTAMRGDAKLTVEVRPDNNWQRASATHEKLEFSGNSRLVIDGDRIVGVQIDQLDITSIEQNLTGSLSLVAGRVPWLIADLQSQMLNVNGLLDLLPKTNDVAETKDLLPSLKNLGAVQLALGVKALKLQGEALSDVRLQVTSAPAEISVNHLDFITETGSLKSQGKLTWKGQGATFESTAELVDVDLDQFLIRYPDVQHVPVSGSAHLFSEGRRMKELIDNLTGEVNLYSGAAQASQTPPARRQLRMKVSRLPDGVEADIDSLQWGDSDLAGSIRYHPSTPPTLEFEIQRGTLSLLPWENSYLKTGDKPPVKDAETTLRAAARASADWVEQILLTPLRLFGDDNAEDTTPKKKLFSTDPLPLNSLHKINMKFAGQLDSLVSTAVTADKLNFNGNLTNGRLDVTGSSGQLNGGDGNITLTLDSAAEPPAIKVQSTFDKVRGLKSRDTYPRSGFVSLESRGQSEADLAANTSGLLYLEFGKGPFDYANSALLTANLTTTVFQTLIPGIDRRKEQLECGTILALFQDGQGTTPYGLIARTNQANLLGHAKVDLDKELLELNIDSRGRQGIGLSVGSIFSNSIQIKGPLTDPKLVPNPTSLAWRAWAAVTTGGLSVLGETVLKRIMASDNPCKSIKRVIVEKLCPTNPIAASSDMVCPKAQ